MLTPEDRKELFERCVEERRGVWLTAIDVLTGLALVMLLFTRWMAAHIPTLQWRSSSQMGDPDFVVVRDPSTPSSPAPPGVEATRWDEAQSQALRDLMVEVALQNPDALGLDQADMLAAADGERHDDGPLESPQSSRTIPPIANSPLRGAELEMHILRETGDQHVTLREGDH